MMATTELQKIPETIVSRSQVHELRTISERDIAAQLTKIAAAEQLNVSDEALRLIARAADGSMRDGLTAFDQVLAFAGDTVSADDVSTVLGLVGRDLLLDILEAVADEHALAAFDLAGRAIDSGYDLRLLCRELSRLVRDLMLIAVDPKRLNDPDVAPAGERERIAALVKRFSREDLLRSFDLIARAEIDLRAAAEPRYHLEMALLKWIHLRKLAPLADLIEQLQQGGAQALPARTPPAGGSGGPPPAGSVRRSLPQRAAAPPAPVSRPPARPQPPPPPPPEEDFRGDTDGPFDEPIEVGPAPDADRRAAPPAGQAPPIDSAQAVASPVNHAETRSGLRDAFVEEVRRAKEAFYRMTVAQAHRIEVEGDRLVFSFAPARRAGKDQIEKSRAWLEPLAARVAGRRMAVDGDHHGTGRAAAGVGARSSPRAAGRRPRRPGRQRT